MAKQIVGYGTILKDFQTLLDYVGDADVKVSDARRKLPMGDLAELNQKLSIPTNIVAGRFKQDKYPGIEGLCLLLLCTGVGKFRKKGKKTTLALDPKMLEKWKSLNEAERYVSLLYYWLFHGRTEIVDDRQTLMGGDAIVKIALLTEYGKPRHPGLEGIKSAGCDKPLSAIKLEFEIKYHYGAHAIVLMEMFGLIVAKQPLKAGREWTLIQLTRTDHLFTVADLTLKLLDNEERSFYLGMLDLREGDEIITLDEFRKQFSTYVPGLNTLLVPCEKEVKNGAYVLNIAFYECRFSLQVPSDCDFSNLAHCILENVNFDDDHLYEFSYLDAMGVSKKIDYEDEKTLGEVGFQPSDEFTFRFDFGDDWIFKIVVESFDPPTPENQGDIVFSQMHGTPPEQYESRSSGGWW